MTIESFEELVPRVHPRAFVHAGAYLLGEVEIAEEASIWPACVLRGDQGSIRIGARTSIQDGSVAHGTDGITHTRIGAECTVGHRVVLHGCAVGDHCVVGMGAILMDEVELGEWCFVAAGSLIPPGKKFPPRSFIVGAPARRLREINEREHGLIEHGWRTYLDLTRRYLAAR